MKKQTAIVLFAISIIIFLTSIYFNSYSVIEERKIYASANFTLDTTGFDVNGTALTFGGMVLGGSATRNVIVHNTYDFPILVEVRASGDLAQFMIYDRYTEFEPGEEKKIIFTVLPPLDAEPGFYDGYVQFWIKKRIIFNK